ncbi:hypothetical protein [Streptomyces sp. WAC04114]|uniref:hypothetical protein n=1 Tax=Streptomyces sp. WAC04114 TaxID=2867961 RepID=UPI0035AC054B
MEKDPVGSINSQPNHNPYDTEELQNPPEPCPRERRNRLPRQPGPRKEPRRCLSPSTVASLDRPVPLRER